MRFASLFLSAAAVFLLAQAAYGEVIPAPGASLLDLLDHGPAREAEGLRAVTQFPGLRMPRPPGAPRLRLFPGPVLLSWDAGFTFSPVIGPGAADDTDPPLAEYRDYWSPGAGLQTGLHLRVLATVDAYAAIGVLHFSSTGKQDWHKTVGTDEIWNRYRFDALTIFPFEFGGKGYLPLKAPPGLTFLDPNREAPMLYLRIGAGPAFVSRVDFETRRYANNVLTHEISEVWWPEQSVLNVHVAVGFEWGSFRAKDGPKTPLGLFAEVGYRFIAAPVVTDFADVSDPFHCLVITVGVHLP